MSPRAATASAGADAPITIRALDRADLERCRELEAQAFDFTPAESLPNWLRLLTDATGGLTLGAYRGERLAGFCYCLPAFDGHAPSLFSLGLVVDPSERGHGIGPRLKLAQRELALARGYRTIEWTIGSLNTRSLLLATSRLGARLTGRFPIALDGIQSHVYMDEVSCRWELLDACPPTPPPVSVARVARFETVARDDGLRAPLADAATAAPGPAIDRGGVQLVELPWDHVALARADAALTRDWRAAVRQALDALFACGRVGTEVVLDRPAQRAWLLFPPPAG